MNATNWAIKLLGPKPHYPTVTYVVYLWNRYGGDPENWDWERMQEWNRVTPMYSTGVNYNEVMHAFFQTGGGRAAKEFFTTPGQIPLTCKCGHTDIIWHKESPFVLVYPLNAHEPGCERDPAQLNSRQIYIGLRWLLIAQVCSLLKNEDKTDTLH